MTTNRTKQYFFLLISMLLLAVIALPAGERTHIGGVSLARAFVGYARGLEAIGTNPANLTLPHREPPRGWITETIPYDSTVTVKDSLGNDSTYVIELTRDTTWLVEYFPPAVSFSIPAFSWGTNFGSDFINYDIYKEYFTGVPDIDGDGERDPRYLNDDDKNKILELFPSGLSETHFDFELRAFGFTVHNDFIGDIGMSVTEKVAANLDLPKDYMRFFFFGLDSLGSFYDFDGTSIRGWHLREYALSYARKLPMLNYKHFYNVSAGLGLKLVHGYEVAITEKYNASFANKPNPNGGWDLIGNFDTRILRSTSFNPDDDNEEYNPIGSPAGTGIGIDLGIGADVYQAIRAGFSITDIGSITWTKNTKETIGNASFVMTNPTQQEQFDSLKDAFTGKDTTTGEFSTTLPTAMRLGAAIQVDQLPFIGSFPGELLVSIEYHQGFNLSPGNTTRARFAIGTEYRPARWIPIRTGISMGGVDRFNWAAGFGLDFGGFNWNFGTENFGLLFSPNNWDQASFGMSMIVRI
ncbi:MAG: hypothetical protein EPO24_08505 [Bacteroidetes bacterium]|nr:MAG: hypothetical protein EPO24_08505 [Bacteroidota bacterium]